MTSPTTQPDDEDSADDVDNGYTAIVHFHGMGSQRRLEETARMIDALDRLQRRSTQEGKPLGWLLGIKPALEKRRDPYGAGRNESFIRTVWRDPVNTDEEPNREPNRQLRFYEVYWAPIMADGKSVVRTLKWVASQLWRPLVTGFTPWRERQRLRRATLMELNQASFWTGINQNDQDIERMATLYSAFESLDAQEAYPKGSFREFLAFVKANHGADATDTQAESRLLELAHHWRRRYRFTEARTFFVLTTVMLATALTVAGLYFGLSAVVQGALKWWNTAGPLSIAVSDLGSAAQITAMLLLAAFSAFGIFRFVTDALGDVEAWSTYAETDEKHRVRKAVLDYGTGLLTHVLADPACKRVVITAHSLGTAIAQDTLLALARYNRAGSGGDRMRGAQAGGVNLKPIEHLVTFGSPIDKIEYFFESSRSQSHRYRRVVEDLRGDIGKAPFMANTKPHIHWINVWDDADLVSGSLQSPTAALVSRRAEKSRPRVRNLVDNLHIEGFSFPDPVGAHIHYLRHRSFVALLFDIIVHRGKSFAAMTPQQQKDKDYRPLIVGPGSRPGQRIGWQLLALALPWVIGITWLLNAVWKISATPGALLALAIIVALLFGFLRSVAKGPQDPF